MIRIMSSLLISNFGNFMSAIFVAQSVHTGNPFFLPVCAKNIFRIPLIKRHCRIRNNVRAYITSDFTHIFMKTVYI